MAARATKAWYEQIGCTLLAYEPMFIAVCLSGLSVRWWQITLLGELRGPNLGQGLSISHLTRAISKENVCKCSIDRFFFLLFLCLQTQSVCHSLLAAWYILITTFKNGKQHVWIHLVYSHISLGKELFDKKGGRALVSLVRGNIQYLSWGWRTEHSARFIQHLNLIVKERWHTPPGSY